MNYIGLDNVSHRDAAEDLWRFVAMQCFEEYAIHLRRTRCRRQPGKTDKHAVLMLRFRRSFPGTARSRGIS